MKRLGITGKLVLTSALIFIALGVAVTLYSVTQLRSILYRETVRRVEAQALNWIEANTLQITVSRDPGTLDRLVRELREREAIAYVILTDSEGDLLAGSGVPAGLTELGLEDSVAGTKSRLVRAADGQGLRYIELATPISASGTGMNPDLETMFGAAARIQTLGAVRVGVDQRELDRRLGSLVLDNVTLYAVLVLLALAVNILLAKRMVTPITAIGRVANEIAAGNLAERVRLGAELQDEVGELVRNFNQMARRLAENREEMDVLYSGLEEKVRERTRELELANRRLQELDELKSHFLSTVSHELRSPLTSIKAFAQILLDAPNPDPVIRTRFLEIIDKESDRLSRLISDLLDLAKIESGEAGWRMSEVDVRQVVVEATAPLVSLAADKGLALDVAESAPHPARLDPDRIQQVVTNLVGNAIKFCPSGGRIQVRLDRVSGSGPVNAIPGEYVRVAVDDSGPGISEEDRERIFDRFYQGVKNRGARSGTGLGLAISREIVWRHKGEIWVESEPGRGSTFYFTVPLREESAAEQTETPGVQTEGRG